MHLFVLKGIDEISMYIGFNRADVYDWIVHCDFPAKRVNGIWVAKKSAVKKWLKWFKPQKPVGQLTIRKQRKIIKRRW